MRKSLTANNSQVSATGLATDPGRGRGGSTSSWLLMSSMGCSPQNFFTAGFSAVANIKKQTRRNERPPLRCLGLSWDKNHHWPRPAIVVSGEISQVKGFSYFPLVTCVAGRSGSCVPVVGRPALNL